MGYYRAGFTEIVGVDIRPQPRYPFTFVQADALEYLVAHGHEFDVIHASPPCQAHSRLNTIWQRKYRDYIEATRDLIIKTGKPYIIENVMGAPLVNPIMLCGTMFGLRVIRHRLFETNPPLYFLSFTCTHHLKVVKKGKKPDREKQFASIVGHFNDIEYAKRAMGIDWMVQGELAQAIPPAYTEWIGRRIVAIAQD